VSETTTEGRVTPLMGQYAVQMKPWIRFISVLTFICSGLMIIVGLAVALIGTLAGAIARETPGAMGLGLIGGAFLGGIYMLIGLVYLAPAVFLNRTASAIKRMQTGDPTSALEDVLKNQKSFWRFVGILTLVGIVLGVLALVAGVGAAMLTTLGGVRS
jgi:uncharacterized protein involved in cysteine biosynthesis